MKKLTKDKAIDILIDVIKNKRTHKDYERVTDYADILRRIITGEDMTPLMRKFDRRESDEQFKQRVRITQHITGTVARNLMKPAYKIPRSNGIQRILKYANDEESKKLHEFNKVLHKFWGDKSLDQYLSDWWIELVLSFTSGVTSIPRKSGRSRTRLRFLRTRLSTISLTTTSCSSLWC